VWQDTSVRVPEAADGAAFENLLTGETLVVQGGVIRLSAALGSFPGAALWQRPERA
jgi:hypothetical protein